MKRLIDIGANLTDSMFKGSYHGSQKHPPDLDRVLERAWQSGLEKILITGGSLPESTEALNLALKDDRLYSTVGCHPTRCNEFENFEDGPQNYLLKMVELIKSNPQKVVAVGEIGLDYNRLNFCSKEIQLRYFEKQLELVHIMGLPMFLHCRASSKDLLDILKRNHDKLKGGVIHSFDGSFEDAKEFINLSYLIGINGCSLKTEENLEVATKLPTESILIETDSPWCEIKPSHAGYSKIKTHFAARKKEKFEVGSMVKGRNEPCNLVQVLEILANLRNQSEEELSEAVRANTEKLFFH